MYKTGNIEVYPNRGYIKIFTSDEKVRSAFSSLTSIITDDCITAPHSDASCLIGARVGLNTLFVSPFWSTNRPLIEGKYTAMTHQLVTAAYIILHPRCFVLSDCRLGKTGSAILALDYIQRAGLVRGGALIITTVTTMRSVWHAGIQSTLPEATIHIVHGKGKEEALHMPADYYITNYDTVRLHKDKFFAAIEDGRISCVLIDELTHVGNSSSLRHKAISALTNKAKPQYVIGMTGSPGCKPEPVFGMVRAINPDAMPFRTKIGWLEHTTYQYGPQPYMRRPLATCAADIHAAMQPSIRFKKEDVLDLPPVVVQDRYCELSKDQQRFIAEFRADAVAFAKSGEVITAANAAVLLGKLLQVPLGFLMHDNGVIDIAHDERDSVILDIIKESEHKTVIFNMFRRRLFLLEELIKGAGISVARIDGGVKGVDRAFILHSFTHMADPQVLVCHPTTVGYGTELSAADTLVLDGPPVLGDFSYMQTLERLSSPKQQADKISIIRVASTREEKSLFSKLDAGQTAGKAVATLFEDMR